MEASQITGVLPVVIALVIVVVIWKMIEGAH